MPDLRYVARALIRARWFTIAAVTSFAVGFGINLAAFSALDRLLFRALPYHEPDRMVLLRMCGDTGVCGTAFPSMVAFEAGRRLTTIEDVGAVAFAVTARATREQTGDPPVSLTEASRSLLRVLGVRPVLGRDFNDEDERLNRSVAIVSFESWRRRFGGSDDILRQELWIGNTPVQVVGVLPKGFIPPAWGAPNAAWDGLVLDTTGWAAIKPEGSVMAPIARLSAGATIDAARAEITALSASLNPKPLDPREGAGPRLQVDSLEHTLFSRFRPYFTLIASAAGLLLLIACANLATLLLARGRSRMHDIAIASALGASRARVMADALAESLLVCAAGASAGFAVLWAMQASLAAVLPPLIGRYTASVAEPRVLAMAMALAVGCTVLAGLLPAVRAARVDLLAILQTSSSRSGGHRLRGGATLIAVQAALGVVLVLSALLVLRSFRTLRGDDIGFHADGLYSLTAQRPVQPDRAAGLASYQQLLALLREVPGIREVAGADIAVGTSARAFLPFARSPRLDGGRFEITANYFDVLQTPLIAGRPFTEAEVAARAPVAILSRAGARTLWPDAAPSDAIGRALTLDGETRSVVGVVADLKRTYGGEVEPALYVPLGAGPTRYASVVMRMQVDAAPDFIQLRNRIEERLGPARLRLSYVPAGLDSTLQDPRFRAVLFAVLAVSALLLSALGLYAVASFDVRQREYEMGVRLSLGATGRDIRRLVVGNACRPVLVGLAVGCVAAYWASQFLQAFLYEIPARDPVMYGAVTMLLLAVAIVAVWLPASRAATLEPARVLRAQ